MRFPPWLHRWVAAGLVGVALASLAAALASSGWPFELFAHFRWQLAAACLALLLLCLPLRTRWMPVVAVLALVCQGVPPARAPWHSAPAGPTGCQGPQLRVASVNLYFRNDDPRRVLQWLRSNSVDVLVLQEFTPVWERALQPVIRDYPHRLLLARDDPYGIALLSRLPLEDARPVDFAADGLPSLVAELRLGGQPLQVIGMHTHWPLVPSLQQARDLGLAHAATLVRQSSRSTVLLGDLNLTPYAPAFSRLLRESGLRDALADRWWRPTWRAGFWPLALPIDHVLVPPTACVQQADIGPDVGSDHRPVLAVIRYPVPDLGNSVPGT